ncbi:MAG: hypothetical protein ABI557_05400 [Aureliella sp.]
MHNETALQVTISSVFRPVLSALAGLFKKLERSAANTSEINNLQSLLETLPLRSDDFEIACNRIGKARRYLQSNEWGAARWELSALESQLRNQAIAKTREPSRCL